MSGRRLSFWDRIRSHFTEALCARLLRTRSGRQRKGNEHCTEPQDPDVSHLGVTAQPGRQSGEDTGRAGRLAWAGDIAKL